jgi:hypothetical protein
MIEKSIVFCCQLGVMSLRDSDIAIKKRLEKEAQRNYRDNNDFRDYMHREYKPDVPKGTRNNRDLTPGEMRDAWNEFNNN